MTPSASLRTVAAARNADDTRRVRSTASVEEHAAAAKRRIASAGRDAIDRAAHECTVDPQHGERFAIVDTTAETRDDVLAKVDVASLALEHGFRVYAIAAKGDVERVGEELGDQRPRSTALKHGKRSSKSETSTKHETGNDRNVLGGSE